MTCRLRDHVWRALGFLVMLSATPIGVLLGEALAVRIGLDPGPLRLPNAIGAAAGVTAAQVYYQAHRKRLPHRPGCRDEHGHKPSQHGHP